MLSNCTGPQIWSSKKDEFEGRASFQYFNDGLCTTTVSVFVKIEAVLLGGSSILYCASTKDRSSHRKFWNNTLHNTIFYFKYKGIMHGK